MNILSRLKPCALSRLALCALLPIVLAGCGSDKNELIAWMTEVRNNTPPIKEAIPEPKRFEPFRYENLAQVEPFSMRKLQAAFDKLQSRSKNGVTPDINRRRESLESYPLEQIRMVGHLSNGKQNFALLQVESLVYQAKVGNYAGQNFGVITRVSESEIKLKEMVQDAAGEWVERETALRLQEGKNEGKTK
jgi:type IV pilus assembly protein PilP